MKKYRYQSSLIVVAILIVTVIVPVLSVLSWLACTLHQISQAAWQSPAGAGAG
jgi:hypothetical protein